MAEHVDAGTTLRGLQLLHLLRRRDFGLLWWGQVTSQMGDALNKVALLWFVYELTGSPVKMTLIGLLQTIPPLVLGPVFGVYLDRLPKKTLMIAVDLARTFLVALIPILFASDALTLERLYVLVFVISVVSTIFGPALIATTPMLVNREHLLPANALLQATNNIGFIVGPALGGLGIALIGAQNVLYVDAATFFVSAVCLMGIKARCTQSEAGSVAQTNLVEDIMAGFRFIFLEHRTLLVLVVISALYHLGVSAFIFLLPVYTKEHLQVGPVQLGWLWSALGIGMLLTSVWLAATPPRGIDDRLKTIGNAMAIGGIAICTLTVLQTTLIAVTLVIVIGSSTAVFNPIASALLQELTPAPLIGRVLTTFSTGAMASAMAGMASFGWMTETAGPSTSLVALGMILVLTAALIISYSRQSRLASART